MKVSRFDYSLSPELIAQNPIEPRDSSRLMVMHRQTGEIEHRRFRDLPEYLEPEDLLIVNDARVLPARIHGVKGGTGAAIELLLLRELEGGGWEVLAKPARRLLAGNTVDFGQGRLRAEVVGTGPRGLRTVVFDRTDLPAALKEIGSVPLPPYIRSAIEDPERYQTVYGRRERSAAAPTAGLHFSQQLVSRLQRGKVSWGSVSLDIGMGTFRPVAADNIEDHVIHKERFEVPEEAARLVGRAKSKGGRVVAVGTTSVRALESSSADGRVRASSGETALFIHPGYEWKIVDGLITNFHLPRSTLLMLVAAFGGYDNVMNAYRQAARSRYRFFSFGDAMLII